ncbi:hypothetical protein M9H77_06797 [Catharanthus roseus]|uniref:Uncharacterized protein n=1 Tax=Catharanthus roseus TaxID=4058 RepID=A0ACC0BT41_CATRO|nr:hypothetical protein M9H77_06797 [Catharanthus roseus]
MVAHMREALKKMLEGFEGQGKGRIIQGDKLEEKIAKNWRRVALPSMIALPLPSPTFEGLYRDLMLSVLKRQEGLIICMDGHLPTQSHQEALSMQQSIEGLARQFQSVARDVEELKKGQE